MRFENGADATYSNVVAICGALGMQLGDLTEARREELRRTALAKLTPDEIEALAGPLVKDLDCTTDYLLRGDER